MSLGLRRGSLGCGLPRRIAPSEGVSETSGGDDPHTGAKDSILA